MPGAAGIGSSGAIDVVVDAVPPSGTAGFEMDMIYDHNVVNVTGKNMAISMIFGGGSSLPISFSNAVPDSDGDFSIAEVDLGPMVESGPGILIRLTVTAAGTGISALSLDDLVTHDGVPDVYDPIGNVYSITHMVGAVAAVGQPCPP